MAHGSGNSDLHSSLNLRSSLYRLTATRSMRCTSPPLWPQVPHLRMDSDAAANIGKPLVSADSSFASKSLSMCGAARTCVRGKQKVETMNELHESCFAFPAMRRYPIHTEEDASNSIAAYRAARGMYARAQREVIEGNLKKAAAWHGIECVLEEAPEAPSERGKLLLKGASVDMDVPIIETMEDLDAAVDTIVEKRASMERADLMEAAKYVYWTAAHTDADMDTDKMRKIARIAGVGAGDREAIQMEFVKRAGLFPMTGSDHRAFWDYYRELKAMPDEEFYKEATLNAVCGAIDQVDSLYGAQCRHGKDIDYPEDVVFGSTMDDIVKQASDLLTVKSIDTTISKKAALERSDAINGFLKAHFSGFEPLEGEKLLEKVASLDETAATALFEAID